MYIEHASALKALSLARSHLHQLIGATIADSAVACTVDGMTEDNSKYLLKPRSGGRMVTVEPANVILGTGARVEVVGLVNGKRHNGKVGRILSHDVGTGRYCIEVRADTHLKLKRTNVVI